jgi:general secretion pathway protein E
MIASEATPLGELLVLAGCVSQDDVNRALELQEGLSSTAGAIGGVARLPTNRLGALLVRTGAISEDALLPLLARQTGYELIDIPTVIGVDDLDRAIRFSGLRKEWWVSRSAIPFALGDAVVIAAKDALDRELGEGCRRAFRGRPASICWARSAEVDRLTQLVSRLNSAGGSATSEVAYLRELAEEAPVIEFVNNVLSQAVNERASDVHIEPSEQQYEVRFRVDGVLASKLVRPREGLEAVVSRIKLVSGLDIAERRLPQDGRITTRVSGVEIDLRVSAIPGVHGESLVLRLLPKERADLSLAALGMASDVLAAFEKVLQQPNGIVLVTGPTGSGKSTTLYSALSAVNDRSRKIVTVEDPVEYRMAGITQIQTHAEIGYTFARALRSILRHDPDVIMIGEIRDAETAEIAIQSALTGHLVLATIHTNDAPSAFTRLTEMGIEPFLLATTVRAVLAQRLVRTIDSTIAQDDNPSPWILSEFERLKAAYPAVFPSSRVVRKVRSDVAESASYKGRCGIHEFLQVTPRLQEAITARRSAIELSAVAFSERGSTGFRTLRDDGMLKAAQGITTIDEVLRVAGAPTGDDHIEHASNLSLSAVDA